MMKMMESSFGQNDRCMYVYIYMHILFLVFPFLN